VASVAVQPLQLPCGRPARSSRTQVRQIARSGRSSSRHHPLCRRPAGGRPFARSTIRPACRALRAPPGHVAAGVLGPRPAGWPLSSAVLRDRTGNGAPSGSGAKASIAGVSVGSSSFLGFGDCCRLAEASARGLRVNHASALEGLDAPIGAYRLRRGDTARGRHPGHLCSDCSPGYLPVSASPTRAHDR
jgi:hypothetical protein